MHFLYQAVPVFAVLGLVGTTSIPVGPFKKQLLDLHNVYREMQGGSDMQALVWDDGLSQKAANWIRRCNFEHESKGYGENLAFNSNQLTNEELINSSMKAWYDEINSYRYGTQSCGYSCHYTQIVWAKTRKVGCAIERCATLRAFGSSIEKGWYLGCWYTPKGNWIGQYPYAKGKACDKCLKGQVCEKGLCTGEGEEEEEGKEECDDKNKNCDYWQSIGECTKNKAYMEISCRKACGLC